MNMSLNLIKMQQENDGFNKQLGFKIAEIKEGTATVEVKLGPGTMNPLRTAHGGVIYSLCDAAAGTAAATRGRIAVTLSGNISYLNAGKAGAVLRAVATERKSGKSTASYAVAVYDDKNTLIADASFSMFYLGTIGEVIARNKCKKD